MIPFLILIAAVLITHWRFRKDFAAGLATTVFLLVLLPIEVRFPLPGALPQLTVHRLILVVAIWHALRARGPSWREIPLPGLGMLLLVGVSRVLSTVTTISFLLSVKELLSYLIEILLFYVIIGKSLHNREMATRLLWSAVYASLVVGMIAWVEKYRGVNLAARLIPDMADYPLTVTATYRHRILLGYAMALPLPIALGLRSVAVSAWQKRTVLLAMLVLPGACYFGNSRGPWVGTTLGMGVMVVTAGAALRKWFVWMGVLVIVVFLVKPGVYDSIMTRWEQTQSTDTLKGRSASYRKELWKVAYKKVTESPVRFVLGYGGGSTELMQLGDLFEFGGGSSALGYTSWDSELAADFVKYGFGGLIIELLLYLYVLKKAFLNWRSAAPTNKVLLSGCFGTVCIFVWSLTNVAIFNPQLTFLFWTVVAVIMRSPYFVDSPVSSESIVVQNASRRTDDAGLLLGSHAWQS